MSEFVKNLSEQRTRFAAATHAAYVTAKAMERATMQTNRELIDAINNLAGAIRDLAATQKDN